MLIFLLLLALGLVAAVYFTYQKEKQPNVAPLLISGGAVLASLVCFVPILLFQSLLTLLILLIWKRRAWSTASLLAAMIAIVIGVHLIVVVGMYLRAKEIDRLRAQYAFESMEDRVPAPRKPGAATVTLESKNQLKEFATGLSKRMNGRERMLANLHNSTVVSFIDSAGFGVGRRITIPTEETLRVHLDHPDQPIAQPAPPPSSTLSPTDIFSEPTGVKMEPLDQLHLASMLDFANPSGFGLIVNRRKVAGFESHRFSEVPLSKEWKVQSIQLVGLLLAETPVVYVGTELPRMDKTRKMPTRPLNAFESAGLEKFDAGANLFIRDTSEGVRMLGAIRSVKQCVQCHGGYAGDLLGAFSYSLQRGIEK